MTLADAAKTAHPLLMEPLTVGSVTLRNRIVMGSMHTGLEDRSASLPKLAAYFAERARGGTALMVTGGYAPNTEGWLAPVGSKMTSGRLADKHRLVTDAVHEHGGRILLQILHAGRYGYHPLVRSASTTKSPISPFKARELGNKGVERTVNDYARAAKLAERAGYDGVEIMGSEGYLINQFLTARTNHRTDRWGGSASKRMRFPEEVVRRTRAVVGKDFLIQYRISLLDLVDKAQSWDETVELAQRLATAGVDIFNTGIGWHEARIPTIVTSVPRGAFGWVSAKLREVVEVPVCASNRINDPDVAERMLAGGQADLISMARPLLADPFFADKVAHGRGDEINTCIACNQACLDHTFANQLASCLVNPRAGRETELILRPLPQPRRLAVVGAGPAGLAAADAAAGRGFSVEVFEADDEIGGQFRYAMRVPGKEEFVHTLRYYRTRMERLGVSVHTGVRPDVARLKGFDEVILATGVRPRPIEIEGADHPMLMNYAELLSGRRTPGRRVAVIGAGGIGIDVSEFLIAGGSGLPGEGGHGHSSDIDAWRRHWGVADPAEIRGGLGVPEHEAPAHEVHLLQRKETPIGKGLGKTTGWVHRAELKIGGVRRYTGVTYRKIDDQGLRILDGEGAERLIAVDSVVVCAGQLSVRELAEPLRQAGVRVHVVGGADVAAELDAKRAIKQGVEMVAAL